jgi:hypothetical protein
MSQHYQVSVSFNVLSDKFARSFYGLLQYRYAPAQCFKDSARKKLSIRVIDSNQVSTVGTSDFGVQMSGIKFWKGDENLRPVYKKIEWLRVFWTY